MIPIYENNVTYNVKIADLYFKIDTYPDKYVSDMLADYMVSECGEDALYVECQLYCEPLAVPEGTRLTEHSETNWYIMDSGVYVLTFYDEENECTCANMYYDRINGKVKVDVLDVATLYGVDTEFFLYNVLERVFRIHLVFNSGIAIHASSIVHDGYGIAFSAESGTGKSTHTELWIKNYPGTYILNDDAPAFRFVNGEWFMYGTPWAGTTGINANVRVPVKALVFLERSKVNSIRDASTLEAIPRIFEAIIHPMSDEVTNHVFESVSALLLNSRVCVLGCNMTDDAPKTVRNYLF